MGELPHDVDWSFVFRIDPDGNVSRVSSTSQEKRFHQMQPVPDNSMYNSENIENRGKSLVSFTDNTFSHGVKPLSLTFKSTLSPLLVLFATSIINL